MRILNWVSTWLQNCCCCCTCPKIGSVIQVLQVTKNKVPPFNRSVQVQNTKSPHSFQFILLMFSLTRSSKPCSRSGWLHQYPQSVNYDYPPQICEFQCQKVTFVHMLSFSFCFLSGTSSLRMLALLLCVCFIHCFIYLQLKNCCS